AQKRSRFNRPHLSAYNVTLSSHLLFGWKTLDQGNGPRVALMVVPRWNVVANEKEKRRHFPTGVSLSRRDRLKEVTINACVWKGRREEHGGGRTKSEKGEREEQGVKWRGWQRGERRPRRERRGEIFTPFSQTING